MEQIRVVELFAGVGGFRLGLEKSSPIFNTIWANQWEPKSRMQHAFDCYVAHFGKSDNHVNEDIHAVINNVPEHDLLVGGFPCQDYSVARTQARGIEGKKGVLWWDINEIIKSRKPKYIMLENVDRLLKSPSSQRGRDFGIMLKCLHDLGYGVEWRVINAAEYGYAQRRRRVFIFAFKKGTKQYNRVKQSYTRNKSKVISLRNRVMKSGFFAVPFPLNQEYEYTAKPIFTSINGDENKDLLYISDNFSSNFFNSGIMFNGDIYTEQTQPIFIEPIKLKDITVKTNVEERFFLGDNLEKWKFLKGSKKIPRVKPNGEKYFFSEGTMSFPDSLELPGRTMLTSESSINRSTHVIKDYQTGNLRKLTPIECERLNGFPDNWTDTGMPERFRYFCMGNALVVPIIEILGSRLLQLI